MSEKHLVTKPAAVFSGLTVISRILGLIRDILAAAVFGAGMFWDALIVAFTIPNVFRSILGEGALASSFVPVFSEYLHKKNKSEAWKIANTLLTLLIIILVSLTVIVIGGVVLIRLNFQLGEKADLIFRLLQIVYPYVIFICIVGLFMGILNTFHKLAVPAAAPAVFNIVLIIGLICAVFLYKNDPGDQIVFMAWMILLGGLVEWMIHIPALGSVGMQFRFLPDWNDPVVKRILFLMGPMILGLGVTQINIIVDRMIALWIGNGAVSKLYFGNRLIQLPIGIFGVALATSSLSVMSKQAARNDRAALGGTLAYGLRLIFYLSLPAAFGFVVLREPIIKILFQHGAFTSTAALGCERVLLCYSLGLFAYIGLMLVTRCFYAMQDTKTPVKVAAAMAFLNLILNLLLMIPLKEAGLALATSICAVLNMSILAVILNKRFGLVDFSGIRQSAFRSGFGACVMGFVCFLLWNNCFSGLSNKLVFQALFLCIVIFIGVAAYIWMTVILGAKEPKEIINNLITPRSIVECS